MFNVTLSEAEHDALLRILEGFEQDCVPNDVETAMIWQVRKVIPGIRTPEEVAADVADD